MKSKLARAPKFGIFVPTMQPGYFTPEEVMAAHRTTFADIKYDGYRAQVHKTARGIKIFTRNGNELNYECYPEVVAAVKKLPTCILEAELVGEGSTHKEVFENVQSRFRRPNISRKSMDNYLASGIIEEAPLSLRVFDTLKFERKTLIALPWSERREYTERFDLKGVQPSETVKVASLGELESLLDETFKERQEGRVCKNPKSQYTPGLEGSIEWVKFKRSEPLDLVVVGFYNEKAYSLDIPFTSVLCAAYNAKTGKYETIGKIGTTRNGIADEISRSIKGKESKARPSNVVFSEKLDMPSSRKYVPASYISPEDSVVLEVKAMNLNYAENWHSCGLKDGKAFSMRIGFAKQVRYDKSPRQATTTQGIEKLYQIQEAKK